MQNFSFYVLQFIYAFIATYAFAIFFNSPRRVYKYSACIGAVAWVLYKYLATLNMPYIIPNFFASLLVAFLGELLAIKLKHPSIIFTIPALVSFVPGYGIYYTMLNMLNQSYDEAIRSGTEAMFVAITLATGVILATSISRIIYKKIPAYFTSLTKRE